MSTATEHSVSGKFNEIAGKVKQSVGETVGNDKLANEGAAQQVKGHAEQAWGTVKGAAEDKYAEVKAEHEAKSETKAHDVRESVTSTAQNAKEKIQHAIHGDKA